MDTTITAPRAEVLRNRYRSRLPKRLQELAGPIEGNVDLPLHIVWSGRTSYSLDRPKSRMTLYRTVLAEGLREDLVTLLHHRLLAEQWPVLRRLISPYIREVWEGASRSCCAPRCDRDRRPDTASAQVGAVFAGVVRLVGPHAIRPTAGPPWAEPGHPDCFQDRLELR
ncbi:hypothetical protein [Streptomyces sp. NPDC049887]|uniref:hypothetical protein n=1 Tax=Streptomyces sp. NPDC049887 TaxID=3155654 RepID=UPI00342E2902